MLRSRYADELAVHPADQAVRDVIGDERGGADALDSVGRIEKCADVVHPRSICCLGLRDGLTGIENSNSEGRECGIRVTQIDVVDARAEHQLLTEGIVVSVRGEVAAQCGAKVRDYVDVRIGMRKPDDQRIGEGVGEGELADEMSALRMIDPGRFSIWIAAIAPDDRALFTLNSGGRPGRATPRPHSGQPG